MTGRVRALAAIVLVTALNGSCAPALSLVGAWHTVEVRDVSGQDITDHNVRNILVFSGAHFAMMWSELDRPRFTGTPSDSQKVAMWQGLGGQGGRYELVGDTLVLHSEIAKNPTAMAAGAFQRYFVREDGDNVWLQLIADNSGPLPNQERARLARLE